MRPLLVAALLLTSRPAFAQRDTVLVTNDAIIRVWSSARSIRGNEGRVTRRYGDTLDVRLIFRDFATETHWESMSLVPLDLDSLDVFLNDKWWRVDMRSGGGLEPGATHTGDIVTGDRLRIWSRYYRMFDHEAQVIRAPADTIDAWLGEHYTDREQLLRGNIDRIAVLRKKGGKGGIYLGALRGAVIGQLGTLGAALLMKGLCSECEVGPKVAAFAVVFGVAGGVAGGRGARPREAWIELPAGRRD